ncbi:MAG: tRNA pseudouridine(55) synthase TruB [Gammaproteobacteria bacterium]|nr:tRNA pseudouridine(55) synthase TruB [Gammaproteobacteria bacterium]
MAAMLLIDGILLVDKPLGLSSNGVLQRAKRLLGAKKAGHTGSLDPLATGMLPICLGEATKFSQYLLDADKAYEVTAVLGAVSSTGDAEGDIRVVHEQVHISEADLNTVLKKLTGPILQTPPMYSALKHKGKPLYTYARRGEVIDRPAREVVIYDIKCHKVDGKSIYLTVKCSKGTYIRSLVETIGEQLGVGGAYVTQLHRTYTAGFEHEPMWTLDALEAERLETRRMHLLPPERAVLQFERLDVSMEVMQMLYQGKTVSDLESIPDISTVRLYSPENVFFGLGEITAEGDLKVKRLKSINNPIKID